MRDKCTLLFPCEWEKEEWDGPPAEIGALDTDVGMWSRARGSAQIGASDYGKCGKWMKTLEC